MELSSLRGFANSGRSICEGFGEFSCGGFGPLDELQESVKHAPWHSLFVCRNGRTWVLYILPDIEDLQCE